MLVDRSALSGIAGTNPVILFAPCFVLADGAGTVLALFGGGSGWIAAQCAEADEASRHGLRLPFRRADGTELRHSVSPRRGAAAGRRRWRVERGCGGRAATASGPRNLESVTPVPPPRVTDPAGSGRRRRLRPGPARDAPSPGNGIDGMVCRLAAIPDGASKRRSVSPDSATNLAMPPQVLPAPCLRHAALGRVQERPLRRPDSTACTNPGRDNRAPPTAP